MTNEQKEKLEKINEDIEFTQRRIDEYTQSLENLQDEKEAILEEILEDMTKKIGRKKK